MGKSKIIYLILLLLILVGLFCLPLVKIPISVSAKGIIRPIEENSKVSLAVGGRVLNANIFENNQQVNKGDTLLVIAADQISNKTTQQQLLASDYALQLADLNKLVRGQRSGLQTGQYQKEAASLFQRLGELKAQTTLAEKEYQRAKNLFDQGVASQAEYEKALYNYQQLKSQSNSITEQQLAQWQGQKRDIERQMLNVNTEAKQLEIESDNYIIRAPISGRLNNYSGIRQGNYVTVGQEIVQITPENRLIAECMVPSSEIGFIKQGQKVRFQIDTYNYNQWGMIDGKVLDIDQNIVVNEQSGASFFKVRCKLDKNFLKLRNGFKATISKGNTLTGRFYLTDRTLWQLLFDRVDDWFNPNLI
ncbi:HlyD family secretion protein [Sphingobacterium sp. SRCM116780]|uniref:HlyD family secretion protein n=1 Tax=Sphingobacterium sp. SRCM116780 TaxID=2907623 RepID=UPI001F37369C|nr:HlyD family efflux transporter periplasmic adaptor subunit [Sphingobacterium sp. SRCM116780]UIR56373.1 HlyD family secretion protein [Sphingobacterium sp. SRCM116780]